MSEVPRTVHIHYLRPPDRKDVFHQWLVHDGVVKVTYADGVDLSEPIRVDDRPVLEDGSHVVWFTFPERWHDIGRFHTADGVFRGWYANILTPPTFHEGGIWRTTDLFLDVWLDAGAARGPGGAEPRVLDGDQFDEAVERGWLTSETRRRALEEVDHILDAWEDARWPPAAAHDWTLERARAVLDDGGQSSSSTTRAEQSRPRST